MSKTEDSNDMSRENTTDSDFLKKSESNETNNKQVSEEFTDEKSQIESESYKGGEEEELDEEMLIEEQCEDTINEEDEEEESKKFVSNKKPVIIEEDLSNDQINSSKTETVIAENKVILDELLNDLNYSVVLTFFDKFREHLQLADYNYKTLESNLLNTKASKFLNEILF
jgi:hypothetical protein